MRLKNGRAAIPDDVIPKAFPEGCPIKAADVKELVEGPSSLEQLCAVKAIGVSGAFQCALTFILWDLPFMLVIVIPSCFLCPREVAHAQANCNHSKACTNLMNFRIKFSVAALGVKKGVPTVSDSIPGLEEASCMLLRVLMQPGSRPLHETIKALLQASVPARMPKHNTFV
jgi:hypothetical protein